MQRPNYIRMIEDFENNKSSALFVKDLSRIGRNYIEVGKLTEEFLPEHDIRLVAVSDGIDSQEGESEFAPIKNLFNEWSARDISKKRRISSKIKGNWDYRRMGISKIPTAKAGLLMMKQQMLYEEFLI